MNHSEILVFIEGSINLFIIQGHFVRIFYNLLRGPRACLFIKVGKQLSLIIIVSLKDFSLIFYPSKRRKLNHKNCSSDPTTFDSNSLKKTTFSRQLVNRKFVEQIRHTNKFLNKFWYESYNFTMRMHFSVNVKQTLTHLIMRSTMNGPKCTFILHSLINILIQGVLDIRRFDMHQFSFTSLSNRH